MMMMMINMPYAIVIFLIVGKRKRN